MKVFYTTAIFLMVLSFGFSQSNDWYTNLSNAQLRFSQIENQYLESAEVNVEDEFLYKQWKGLWQKRLDDKHCLSHQQEISLFKNSLKVQRLSGPDNPWKSLGPLSIDGQSTQGRVTVVKVHPKNEKLIYVGTPSGGLWISNDGGQNWTTPTDQLYNLGISDIAFDPIEPDLIYLATGDRDFSSTLTYGVIFSYDGGDSWVQGGLIPGEEDLPNFFKINKLVVNKDYILAATSHGVYHSNDGGFGWELSETTSNEHIRYLISKPDQPSVVYASSLAPNANFFRSTNYGKSFTEVALDLPADVDRLAIGVSSASIPSVYLLCASKNEGSNDFSSLFISNNSGKNFEEIDVQTLPQLGSQSWFAWDIAVSNNNVETIFASGASTYKSEDGGKNWFAASNDGVTFLSPQHHSSYFDKNNNLYVTTSGGLFRTQDEGLNWENISKGMGIAQYSCLSTNRQDISKLVAGSISSGTHLFNGESWTQFYQGNALNAIWDPLNESRVYLSTDKGQVVKTENSGLSFKTILKSTTLLEQNHFVPIALNPNDHSSLFAGKELLLESLDHGELWNSISVPLVSNSRIEGMAFSKVDSDLSFYYSGDKVYRSKNANLTFELISSFDERINCLIVDRVNENRVLVATESKVFESVDQGVNWKDLNFGLGEESKNVLAIESNYLRSLYLGTDAGLFYKDDVIEAWIPYQGNLPRVRITDIEILEEVNLIRIASNGRGIWENSLFNVNCNPEIPFVLPSNALLDNDCDDLGEDDLSWRFQWSLCEDIEKYHFQVLNSKDKIFLEARDLEENKFIYNSDSPIEGESLQNWSYRIRAYRDGGWDDWGVKHYFDIEEKGTDCLGTYCNVAKAIKFSSVQIEPGPNIGYGGINDGTAFSAGWYKFEAKENGLLNIYSCGADVDTRLWIYRGNCEELKLIASSDDDCQSEDGQDIASAVYNLKVKRGSTYYIEWDNYWSDEGFEWSIDVLYDLECDLFSESASSYNLSDNLLELGQMNWNGISSDSDLMPIEEMESPCSSENVFSIPFSTQVENLFEINKATKLEYRFQVYFKEKSLFYLYLITDSEDAEGYNNNEGMFLTPGDSFWWSLGSNNSNRFQIRSGEWYDVRIQIDLFGANRYFINDKLIGTGSLLNQNLDGIFFDGTEGDFLVDCFCVSTISEDCPANISIEEGTAFADNQTIYAQETVKLSDKLDPNNLVVNAGNCLLLEAGFEINQEKNIELNIATCPE